MKNIYVISAVKIWCVIVKAIDLWNITACVWKLSNQDTGVHIAVYSLYGTQEA